MTEIDINVYKVLGKLHKMIERIKGDISPTEYLRILRDDYSDEIPEKILHGPIVDIDKNIFKVRRNWWNEVVGRLARLQSKGLVPSDLEEEVKVFLAHYSSEEFHHQSLTTADDIQTANDLITRVISDK